MAFPKVKISDNSGNAVSVTDNKLDVNAYLSATPTIDIGDVSLLLGGTAADTGLGVYGAQTLRVTMAVDDALLSAMNTNLADIEALLTTIDSDTGGMLSAFNAPVQLGADVHAYNHNGMNMLAVRNDELAAFNLTADGDYSSLQVNALGALYTTGGEVENAAVQSEPTLIGGRFDSSARTLGNGDAGAVALNASGHILMDVVDGGQLDTIIDTLETTLTAIETDQAAIETLLTGIDSDTDAIKTAVEILDNAISGNEMQVDVVAALPAGTNKIGNVGHDITHAASSKNTAVGTSIEDLHGTGDVACKRIDMMASPDNTGYIWVGGTSTAVGTGIRLAPGDFYSVDIDNTDDIQVVASVNNEDISYTIFT